MLAVDLVYRNNVPQEEAWVDLFYWWCTLLARQVDYGGRRPNALPENVLGYSSKVMKESIALQVNGEERVVQVEPAAPLLYVLRNHLQLSGPKYGCGLEQCGSCMVLLNGDARPSCRLPVAAAAGMVITTLEGLADSSGESHLLQDAIVEHQAAQCGYCLNGIIMAAAALLRRVGSPDREAIDEALSRNLCRCGTHARFIRAIQTAANKMASSAHGHEQ